MSVFFPIASPASSVNQTDPDNHSCGFFARVKRVVNSCALPETLMVAGLVLTVVAGAVAFVAAAAFVAPFIALAALGVLTASAVVFLTGAVIHAVRSYQGVNAVDVNLSCAKTPEVAQGLERGNQFEVRAQSDITKQIERDTREKASKGILDEWLAIHAIFLRNPDLKSQSRKLQDLLSMVSLFISSLENTAKVDQASEALWKETIGKYTRLQRRIEELKKQSTEEVDITDLVCKMIKATLEARYSFVFTNASCPQYLLYPPPPPDLNR